MPRSERTRLPRLTFRVRLTVAFGAVAFSSGALMVALIWLFMSFVPYYDIPMPDDADPSLLADQQSTQFVISTPSDVTEFILRVGVAALVALAAIASWTGWVISGRMLQPLSRINEAARRAGEGDLGYRIRLQGPRDEVSDLAQTFDLTFDRLQRVFEAHTRFTANAAHELRTPLTATKAMLEIADAHPAAISEAELIAGIRSNNDRSIELVQALLTLTALETATAKLGAVDLAQLAGEAIARRSAAGAGFAPVTELLPAPALAEAPLMALLLDNLLQNAHRHNDSRGYIRVRTGEDADGSWVEVENTGGRIDESDLAKLTEPLFRPRRTSAEGHGLGLAIVTSIVDRHGAELRVAQRNAGGLAVTVVLPQRRDQR